MPVRLGDDRREVVGEASSPLRFVAPTGDACWEISRTDSLTTGFEPSGCTQEKKKTCHLHRARICGSSHRARVLPTFEAPSAEPSVLVLLVSSRGSRMLRRNSFSCCSNGSVSGTASLCLNPEKCEGCEGEEGVWRGCGGGEESDKTDWTLISLERAPTFCRRNSNRKNTRDTWCTSNRGGTRGRRWACTTLRSRDRRRGHRERACTC